MTTFFTSPRLEVDLDTFLAQPLVAYLATHAPTIRPIWFLWEVDTCRGPNVLPGGS